MVRKRQGHKISWYRSPVDMETLAELNQRSDWKGLLQTGGYLGLLALTGAAAWYAAGRLPMAALLLILFLHGTFWAFLLNAFHEFCSGPATRNTTSTHCIRRMTSKWSYPSN